MENQTIERTILSNLINNEEFARKVLPFIKADYFDVKEERIIFDEIQNFVDKYNKPSTQDITSAHIKLGSQSAASITNWAKVEGIPPETLWSKITSPFVSKTIKSLWLAPQSDHVENGEGSIQTLSLLLPVQLFKLLECVDLPIPINWTEL